MTTLAQLEYILAVEELRHFGKAAKRCLVSQPSLSVQIQNVEEEIGFVIFDRSKKPVVPSPKGEEFIMQARRVVGEHHKLQALCKYSEGRVAGCFTLAVIPTIAPYLLPLWIQGYSKKFPDVTLTIIELTTSDCIAALRRGEIDAAIAATPLKERGLKEMPLYHEPFRVYGSPDHPLFKNERVSADKLLSEDMWLLEDGHCFREQMLNICNTKQGVNAKLKNIFFNGGSLEVLRQIIRNASGYTLVPELMARTFPKREQDEMTRPFKSPQPLREVSLVHAREQWKRDILATLQETIQTHLPADLARGRRANANIIEFV